MHTLTKILLPAILLLPLQAGAAGDFTTEATVRDVIDCMTDNGGLTDENFYYCTCKHDALAREISFSDYEEGITYERNKPMPGEKGAVFRGNKRGQEMYDKLLKARKSANSHCTVVKRVTR